MNVPAYVPWLLALCSALVQAHGATTMGHLMWLAPIPWGIALILACRDLTPRSAARRGAALGALVGVVSSAHLWGIAYYHESVYLVVLVYHALVWGTFSAYAGLAVVRAGTLFPLAAGAAWAFIETLRSLGSFSFPFYFGGTLADELTVSQIASVVGTSGLSGLLFFTGFGLAGPLAALWGERRFASARVWAPGVLAAIAAVSYGTVRLASAREASRTLRVSALQASIPSWLFSLGTGPGPFRGVVEQHYGFLYREALASKPPPDLVLFPETTFDWHIAPTTEAMRRLAPFSAERLPRGTAVLFGASFADMSGINSVGSSNGVGVATGDDTGLPVLREVITKHQLVPFIEVRHRPSNRWQLARAGAHEVGMMVCYESMYTESALFSARAGAEVLVILSDDAGMRHAAIAWTHAEQARMRALEVGLPLVRAGQVGVTYATDAYGRMLGRIGAWESGQLTRDVPLHDVDTPYRRIGAWWSWVWLALAVLPVARFRARASS
jgi:apolipoprotein N-acyltransferase